jgi:hypothetical protein
MRILVGKYQSGEQSLLEEEVGNDFTGILQPIFLCSVMFFMSLW